MRALSGAWCIGVDVGGEKRGYHVAGVLAEAECIAWLLHALEPEELGNQLTERDVEPAVIAIDSPPRAVLQGSVSRISERQLAAKGYRVQWTRRGGRQPLPWMVNGERLWRYLALRYPEARLIETFPTAVVGRLHGSPLCLPLNALAPHKGRRDWKDFVDACLCAEVAWRYFRGEARRVGMIAETGEEDELGPIYF